MKTGLVLEGGAMRGLFTAGVLDVPWSATPNPTEFHIVATDCKTGRPVYKRLDKADERTFDWIRASVSIPLVSATSLPMAKHRTYAQAKGRKARKKTS